MPARNKVYSLPIELRQELDDRLLRGGFQGYQQLADWLVENGHEISRSAVHRYGQDLEQDFLRRLDLLRKDAAFSRAAAEAIADEEGLNNEALLSVLQGTITELVWQIREDPELSRDDLIDTLKELGLVGAKVSSAATAQKRFASELRARAESTAKSVRHLVKKKGLDKETIEEIYNRILGVAT